MASVWPLYHKGLIGRVLERWLSFWKVLPYPQRIAQFGRAASSRMSLGGSKLFPFKNDGGHCVLSDLQKNLDPYKSAGLDNLDPFFLK